MTTIKDLERIQGNIALIAIIGLVLGIVSLLICFYLVFQVDNFSQGTWMKGCDHAEQYYGIDKWEIFPCCALYQKIYYENGSIEFEGCIVEYEKCGEKSCPLPDIWVSKE